MRSLVTWSVRVRAAVAVAALGLVILAVLQLPGTPLDTLPEFSRTRVEVQTEALGLSAREVEQLVTVPLEQNLLNGVAFLDEIESASLPGLSSVVMTFEPGTDELTARQVVTERLTQAAGLAGLMQVAKPPQMLQPRSSTSRVAMVGLTSPGQSQIEVSVLARWVIVPRLLGVEGVANVAIWGFRDRQLQVTVDPDVLRDRGVSLSQVVRTTGNALEVSPLSYLEASAPGTGGWIETVNQRLHIFHEQTITTPEELSRVPLEDAAGAAVFAGDRAMTLGDVSEVREDHQPLIGDAFCGGAGDGCLLLVVESFPDANTLQVSRGVEQALEDLRPGLGGIEIDTSIYRPAQYIETAFRNLGLALVVGGVLLFGVLMAFFASWRAALVALATVALALAAAALVLFYRGVTVNMMVVAGLLLGLVLIVDDALVGIHNVTHRLRLHGAHRTDHSAWRRVVDATLEMRSPLVYGTLIAVAVAVPMLFTDGVAGAFLPPILLTYVLAGTVSLLVAVTVAPALAVLLLAPAQNERPARAADRVVRRGYDRVAGRLVPRPGRALVVWVVLVALGGLSLAFVTTSLRPSLREGNVLVHVEGEPGTSLTRMREVLAAAVDGISALSEVRSAGAHAGRALLSDEVVNVSSGEIWAEVDLSADHEATLAAISAVVSDLPDVSHEVLTYSDERIRDVLGGATEDELVVRLYGEEPDVLRATADRVRGTVAAVDGVEAATVEMPPEEPTIEVEVDLDAAQRLGVSPGDVRRSAAILLSGLTVGHLFDEQKVFDVVVWGQPELRQDEEDVRQLLVDTADGGHVRLGEVADVRRGTSPAVIRHHSVMNYRDVTVSVGAGDRDEVASAVMTAVRSVDFPLEYHAELLDSSDDQGAAGSRALAVGVAVAITVLLLFQAVFGSWRGAALAFACLPAALSGAVVAVLVSGRTVTLGAVAGLLAVVGVAARALVVMVSTYQGAERDGREPFGPALVLGTTRDRAAPLVGSAIATTAVLAPFALAAGAPGFELVGAMVIVVLGGLVTSTVVCLFVAPALYLAFGHSQEPDPTAEDLAPASPAELDAPVREVPS